MNKFYRFTEFWLMLPVVALFPWAAIGYNLARGISKQHSPYKPGLYTSELYVSLGALGSIYYQHMPYYIGACVIISYCLSRGIAKVSKPHNVKISH